MALLADWDNLLQGVCVGQNWQNSCLKDMIYFNADTCGVVQSPSSHFIYNRVLIGRRKINSCLGLLRLLPEWSPVWTWRVRFRCPIVNALFKRAPDFFTSFQLEPPLSSHVYRLRVLTSSFTAWCVLFMWLTIYFWTALRRRILQETHRVRYSQARCLWFSSSWNRSKSKY